MNRTTLIVATLVLSALTLSGCATTRSGAPAPVVKVSQSEAMYEAGSTFVKHLMDDADVTERCAVATVADQRDVTLTQKDFTAHVARECASELRIKVENGTCSPTGVNTVRCAVGNVVAWVDKDLRVIDVRSGVAPEKFHATRIGNGLVVWADGVGRIATILYMGEHPHL